MYLAQDRKWFFDRGSFVEILPYEYCIGNEMGERFPTCIAGTFY